jgi:hypothetical protein
MRRKVATSALTVALVLGMTASVAFADYVYESGRLYGSSYDCVDGYAEISHGSGGGYRKAKVSSFVATANGYCAATFSRPPGYLKVDTDMFVWVDNGGYWALCIDGAYHYNGSSKSSYTWAYNQGTSPVCGWGWYGINGYSFMLNGDWKGGALWSKYHYLPA